MQAAAPAVITAAQSPAQAEAPVCAEAPFTAPTGEKKVRAQLETERCRLNAATLN
jgi:hypothetical protein